MTPNNNKQHKLSVSPGSFETSLPPFLHITAEDQMLNTKQEK
jgi:hypothetical protein